MINNRYSILCEIGRGRSRVFCCLDKYHPGEKFAMKVLSGNSGLQEEELFLDEYTTLLKLNHLNIIKAAGNGTIQRGDENEFNLYGIKAGCKFILMEYFDGEKITATGWVRSEENLKRIITQLCSALLYLHHSNYVYSDLKADNILVSKSSNNLSVKLIDMGFACSLSAKQKKRVSGSLHYIAPELLQGTEASIQSDLFSLGVLLYKLVYDRFPFEGKTEAEVFNSTISSDPLFPQSKYSSSIIRLIQRLLSKDLTERYGSVSELLNDLDCSYADQLLKEWSPAKVLIGRKETDQLKSYLKDNSRYEVLLVKGIEGTGKTTLLNALKYEHPEVIYIGKSESLISGNQLIEEILFHPFVYRKLSDKTRKEAVSFLKGNTRRDVNTFYLLKLLLIKISSEVQLALIFDDFSSYDTYTMVSLTEVIRLLQSRKSKVIISDTAPGNIIAENIHNISEVALLPFSNEQLLEFLTQSFSGIYPVDEIYRVLSGQLSLTPGGIYNSIKSMYENEVFEIAGPGKISIKQDAKGYEALISVQKENYRRTLGELSDNARKLLELCSMVSVNLDLSICADLLELSQDEIFELVSLLKTKGILKRLPNDPGLCFKYETFKLFVYSEIENTSEKHKHIARFFEVTCADINSEEIARQYELSGDFNRSFDIHWGRLLSVENKDSLRFQREILLKLSEFPVCKEKIFKARLYLLKVLQKLGDNRLCLDLISKYSEEDASYLANVEFALLEGICMIELGETEEGRKKIQDLTSFLSDEKMKLYALLYLAYASFDLGQYDDAFLRCNELIGVSRKYPEFSGKGHNLLGLIEFNYKNNLSSAIQEFTTALYIYTKARLPMLVAAVEVNIGNLYNMQGNLEAAEKHWKNSLAINSSIGNLDQEAKLLLNLGIHFYDKSDYSLAIKQYSDAQFIFSNIGDEISEGLTLSNMGEVFLSISDYSGAFLALSRAKEIFTVYKSITELVEVEYLFGKFYFQLGDSGRLKSTIEMMQKYVLRSASNPRHNEYLRYLIELKHIQNGDIEFPLTRLLDIRESFYSFSGRADFLSVSLLIAKLLVKYRKYSEAAVELNEKRFEEFSRYNIFVKAERNILLSRISARTKSPDLLNRFEYLDSAYSLIEDQFISETTWEVLYYMAVSFFERGNTNKAAIYTNYALRVLSFIGNRIEDTEMRQKYLSSSERQDALQRLNEIQEQTSCN